MRIPGMPMATFRTYDGGDTASRVAADLLDHPTPYAVVRYQKKSELSWAVLVVDDDLIRRLKKSTSAITKTLGLGRILRSRPIIANQFAVRTPTESIGNIFSRIDYVGAEHPFAVIDSPHHVQALLTQKPLPAAQAFLFPRVTSDRDAVAADEVLEFTLTLEVGASDALAPAILVRFPDGKPAITLHAEVSSSELEPVDGAQSWTQDIVVDRSLSCSPASWSFKARAREQRATYALLISFHSEGNFLGAAKVLRSNSDVAKPAPPPNTSSAALALPGETKHHRQVSIVEQGAGYRVWLYESGNKVGEVDGDWRPDDTYFQMLENARTRDQMIGIGASLSVDLPPELREFIERDESPIMFASDPRVAPFEWIQLRPSQSGPFLGTACVVSRCTRAYGSFDQPLPPPKNLLCIRPSYEARRDLPSAAKEEDWLRERFGDRVCTARTTVELKASLGQDNVGLIHFAGHADGSPAGLELEDDRVTPSFFHPSLPALRNHPVIFVNGCRAALGSDAPAALSNFARFLSASCAAIVAPLVSVDSEAALVATKIFYESLDKESIAECVMRIRRAGTNSAREEASVSLMSYVAFAAPSQHVDLSAMR